MFRSIAMKLGGRWVGAWIAAAAAGKKGPGKQKLYLFLQGKKTVLGLVLGAVCAVLIYLSGDPGILEFLTGTVAVVLTSAGLLDKSWRTPPTAITSHPAYRLAVEHAADIGMLTTAAAAALATCTPGTAALLAHVHVGDWVLTCGQATLALGGSLSIAAWLGLEVHAAEPPRVH